MTVNTVDKKEKQLDAQSWLLWSGVTPGQL